MSRFSEAIASNPRRLVVTFARDDRGTETFQWGLMPKGAALPTLTMIGVLSRAQHQLAEGVWPDQVCDEWAFVAVFNEDKTADLFVHPEVPVDPLIGMLEKIKALLVGAMLAKEAQAAAGGGAQRKSLLGPDGQPMRG